MLKILYEDRDILAAVKPPGMDSQASRGLSPDMVSEIKKHLHQNGAQGDPYVGVVHRLDKMVGGVMVYAKNKQAAAKLSGESWREKAEKTYYAVVRETKEAEDRADGITPVYLRDWLVRDPAGNRMIASREEKSGYSRAELVYREIACREEGGEKLLLLEVKLITGLQHQIRAQLALHGLPILGDSKYGGADLTKRENPALAAVRLTFPHPADGRRMSFSVPPEAAAFRIFKEISV